MKNTRAARRHAAGGGQDDQDRHLADPVAQDVAVGGAHRLEQADLAVRCTVSTVKKAPMTSAEITSREPRINDIVVVSAV